MSRNIGQSVFYFQIWCPGFRKHFLRCLLEHHGGPYVFLGITERVLSSTISKVFTHSPFSRIFVLVEGEALLFVDFWSICSKFCIDKLQIIIKLNWLLFFLAGSRPNERPVSCELFSKLQQPTLWVYLIKFGLTA